MSEDKKVFSEEYYKGKRRIASLEEQYQESNNAREKARLELIAFLEAHMPHLKRKLSNCNNFTKQHDLLDHVDYRLYDIQEFLYEDKAIKKYLNKHGFLSPSLYVIIDLIITIIISSIALFVASGLGLEISPLVVFYWVVGTLIVSFLMDLTTYMNFYKVHK